MFQQEIWRTLAGLYPQARTALQFTNPFQLLVATMLSAQSTDQQVNRITHRLFACYPTPASLAELTPEELAGEIRSCGLYRTKSQNIVTTCRQLLERFGGEVPANREDLMSLPGVGRKTANVVLANAFDQPALAVDTHVFRVAHRLGLARGRTPEQTEAELCRLLPPEKWGEAHHWLIYHGRSVCRARRPACEDCAVAPYCPACASGKGGSVRGPASGAGQPSKT